jgi:cytoskeletal protein CcmA (bactofilin family)
MFSRAAAADTKSPIVGLVNLRDPARPAAPNAESPRPIETTGATPRPTSNAPPSVIGSDITIRGSGLRIESVGTLVIDGRIDGDVQGAAVVIGPGGMVNGAIAADEVTVRGTVNGQVVGRKVVLDGAAQVHGDVFHQNLTISVGAAFEGRSRRLAPNAAITLDTATAFG